jgi:hypothetical protein
MRTNSGRYDDMRKIPYAGGNHLGGYRELVENGDDILQQASNYFSTDGSIYNSTNFLNVVG